MNIEVKNIVFDAKESTVAFGNDSLTCDIHAYDKDNALGVMTFGDIDELMELTVRYLYPEILDHYLARNEQIRVYSKIMHDPIVEDYIKIKSK